MYEYSSVACRNEEITVLLTFVNNVLDGFFFAFTNWLSGLLIPLQLHSHPSGQGA